MKKFLIWGVSLAIAGTTAFIGFAMSPGCIEGIWHNQSYVSCLCPSRNFLVFENGNIAFYSDNHISNLDYGTYSAKGDGLYEVRIPMEEVNDRIWTLRPRKLLMFTPENPTLPKRMSFHDAFHRATDRAKDLNIIETAADRNERIRKRWQRQEEAQNESSPDSN